MAIRDQAVANPPTMRTALAGYTHPKFRDELERQAREMGYV
jgi:hypothetical protein